MLSDWPKRVRATVGDFTERDLAMVSQLYQRGRLTYGDQRVRPDFVDAANALSICALVRSPNPLLIKLPDEKSPRPAFMLAAGLVTSFLSAMDSGENAHPVVYFGSEIGIREQLSGVKVSGLPLSSFIQQADLSRGRVEARTAKAADAPSLPRLVTAYSPADSRAVLELYRPSWVAGEISGQKVPAWVEPALEWCCTNGIPFVCWTTNHLLPLESLFRRSGGKVFGWKHALGNPSMSSTLVTPLFVDPGAAVSGPFLSVYRRLRVLGLGHGRLEQDSVRALWALVGSLEQLAIPLDIHTEESWRHWGMSSISDLQKRCLSFAQALDQSGSASLADVVRSSIEEMENVISTYRTGGSALWRVLSELCARSAREGSMCLVFRSERQRQLFQYSLLAIRNISEDDLANARISLKSVAGLRTLIESSSAHEGDLISRKVILVGLPSMTRSAALEPLFRLAAFSVLAPSHKQSMFTAWIKWLDQTLSGQFGPDSVECGAQRVSSGTSSVYRLSDDGVSHKPVSGDQSGLWTVPDNSGEWRWLMEATPDSGRLGTMNNDPLELDEQDDEEPLWVEDVFVVQFREGWYGFYLSGERLQVISSQTDRLQERYVGALRDGERVAVVPNHGRQSLYDMVLERLHHHQAVGLHVNLVQQWQREMQAALRKDEMSFEEILSRMRLRGSSLSSTQTFRLWLKGHVLAPDDPEDLLRLADILHMPFCRNYYKQIHRAARRLTSIHRQLSRQLNKVLLNPAQLVEGGDRVIDRELDLMVDDFRQSLMLLTVQEVVKVPGPFPRAEVGTLKKGMYE